MRYSVLFLDLDGTTIPPYIDAHPSRRVVEAIRSLEGRMTVCIATGRPLLKAAHIFKELDIKGPSVLLNGVQLYDPIRRLVVRQTGLPIAVIPAIAALGKKFRTEVLVFCGDSDMPLDDVPPSAEPLTVYFPDVLPPDVQALKSKLSGIPGIAVHEMPSWKKGFISLDITHQTVSKLHGVSEVIEMLGVSREQVVGVGDSLNDYPLLMACGLKIAMRNAHTDLQAVADFIAPSVEDDGVAVLIEKLLS